MNNVLEIFAGPCVLESENLVMETAQHLSDMEQNFNKEIAITFKGSFDKANRTSSESYRGPGMVKGLHLLEQVKKIFNLPLVTDIHHPEQAEAVAEVVDVLQIPAFLCRQTDLVIAAAKACKKYHRRLKIKKGQFLAPEQTQYIIQKVIPFISPSNILLTERGSCFGYERLIVDMGSFEIMKNFGVKTVYDVTHSIQKPGGKTTGGYSSQAPILAAAALAAGADALFLETHPCPREALSDAATQIPLEQLQPILARLLPIYRASSPQKIS